MKDEIRILVIDRGHVMVCRCPEVKDTGFWVDVTDARIITRWGTTKGLAELKSGPTDNTVLAAATDETIPTRAIIRVLKVEQDKWKRHLPN